MEGTGEGEVVLGQEGRQLEGGVEPVCGEVGHPGELARRGALHVAARGLHAHCRPALLDISSLYLFLHLSLLILNV